MKLIVICGATATGKSDLAISVAQKIDAEIINADSMQLYKGMDIGTAKLSVEERQGIPHHLLDVLEVTEDANVAWYQSQARAKIAEIQSRGKSVVIVGGTGLYIKAILDELYKRNIQSVLVEGGSRTLQYFIIDNVWDEARVIVGNIRFHEGVKAPVINRVPVSSHPFGNKDTIYYYSRR